VRFSRSAAERHSASITETLNWHWIFFVNLPIGIATIALGGALIPQDRELGHRRRVDWLGSVLVAASLMTAIYAIVRATSRGWVSLPVIGLGTLAAALMAAFLAFEVRVENPIMPLRVLRLYGLVGASVVRGFLVTGMYSTFFLGALYLEHVRYTARYRPGWRSSRGR
jgi:MFS family permease